MREFKFRAWDKINGMVHFDFDDLKYRKVNISHGCYDVPVMQYADLKDQNDKEIYEHDILEFTIFEPVTGGDTPHKGVVVFSDGQFQIWRTSDDKYFGSDGPFNLHAVWYNDDTVEIVGNIYENPDILPKAIESTESCSGL